MDIYQQISTVNPSVPAPLFRLLMREDDLSYLRENNGIYGFEVLEASEPLSGFALIAMRKRTILAYRSEDKIPRLIIFPSMEKLFDEAFELLGLTVQKVFVTDETFVGQVVGRGTLADLVRDLTPPEKKVELPESVTEQMIKIMIAEHSDAEEEDIEGAKVEIERFKPKAKPIDNPYFDDAVYDEPPIEEPPFEEPPFEEPPFEDSSLDVPVVMDLEESPRNPVDDIKSQTFVNEHSVIDYVSVHHGVDRSLLVKLLNALLQKTQGFSTEERTKQYVLLVCRLFEEGKV